MTWFVASIVSVIEIIDGSPQEEFPIYEDYYLFNAASENELQIQIKSVTDLIDAAGTCNLAGRPATKRSLGVRKIRSIYNDPPRHIDNDPPDNGTELSHSFFVASTIDDAMKFAGGRSVVLRCVDDSTDDDQAG